MNRCRFIHGFEIIKLIVYFICQEEDGDVSAFSVHVILPDVDITQGVPPGHVTHDDAGLGGDIEGDR